MTHSQVKYGILLTKEQLNFMKDDKYGFHRMKALETFATQASTEPCHYEKTGYSTDLDTGQFAMSKVELCKLWNCDRKTAVKVVKMFNDMGMVTSEQNNRTTIHTIHFLAFWIVDEARITIKNPYYKEIVEYTGNWLSHIATKPEILPPPYNKDSLDLPSEKSSERNLESKEMDSKSAGDESVLSSLEQEEFPKVNPLIPAGETHNTSNPSLSEDMKNGRSDSHVYNGQPSSLQTKDVSAGNNHIKQPRLFGDEDKPIADDVHKTSDYYHGR